MRLFIGIDLSSEVRKEINKILKVLEKKHWKVKWESPSKLHITLAFIGNLKTQSSKVIKIKTAIETASRGIQPFVINFKGLGCFPSYDYPRVIWLGLKGDLQSLAKLQKNIRHELLKLYDLPRGRVANRIVEGLRRPFSAHLTLGRIKDCRLRERQEIGRQIKKFKEFKSLRFNGLSDCQVIIKNITIFESKLSRLGSEYRKISEICLIQRQNLTRFSKRARTS